MGRCLSYSLKIDILFSPHFGFLKIDLICEQFFLTQEDFD